MKLKHIFLAMVLALCAVAANASPAQAYAGEDPWDMIDRIFYRSGSWMIKAGSAAGVMPQAKMRQLIVVNEIYNCSPEREYAEGSCTIVPGKEGEETGDFILMDGFMVYVQEPGTNKTFFAMKRL